MLRWPLYSSRVFNYIPPCELAEGVHAGEVIDTHGWDVMRAVLLLNPVPATGKDGTDSEVDLHWGVLQAEHPEGPFVEAAPFGCECGASSACNIAFSVWPLREAGEHLRWLKPYVRLTRVRGDVSPRMAMLVELMRESDHGATGSE